eukprot:TRINITY_DN4654_c7_g1_i1.p1 TRINITY_DN4654_c7_g1~~TRINITY_DN4654_c7_g1_i1.p1  ORF type:complete len:292 (+),score=33.72 TRINITY_DN4654_c7_g1_i1:25-900(+)
MHLHVTQNAKQANWRDFGIGVVCEIMMTLSLGQPIEVIKTRRAVGAEGSMLDVLQKVHSQGGLRGVYAGFYPWGCIESLTGGVLVYTNHKVQTNVKKILLKSNVTDRQAYLGSHVIGGMAAGTAQGVCLVPIIRMKVSEMTRVGGGTSVMSNVKRLIEKEGLSTVYKGSGPLLMRQVTNWGSRFGMARALEERICESRSKGSGTCSLTLTDRGLCSLAGGVFSCWNHPFDVVSVTMQSRVGDRKSAFSVAHEIYAARGLAGFTRGLRDRILLSCWATLFMVVGTDFARSAL